METFARLSIGIATWFQHKALCNMYRALRPGGWVGAIVYATAEENDFFSIPIGVIRRRAALPAPVQGQPGPFSLGKSGVIETAFMKAGFKNVEARKVSAVLDMTSVTEFLRFAQESFGALHQMLAGLDEQGKRDAWAEIETALGRFEHAGRFNGPCTLIVAAGQKPA
jgi:hypothetical protein